MQSVHDLRQDGGGIAGNRLAGGAAAIGEPVPGARRSFGLSAKLLVLTAAFVMLAEVLIFVPSISNFRVMWLSDRLAAAYLASLATEAVPGGAVPAGLRDELLRSAQVKAVAVKRNGIRRLVLADGMDRPVAQHFDLRTMEKDGSMRRFMARLGLIWDAMAVFQHGSDRRIRVVGQASLPPGDFVEIVLAEGPLSAAMVHHSLNILLLSVVISIFTAALVYLVLNRLLVQPMMRLSRNMEAFGDKPEDASRIISPSTRDDELGVAERELQHMQTQLVQSLQQKSRLAALGLAVSKINHDLRNMLSSAQLLSDLLSTLPDPTVQRITPKLLASLDRAIALCNNTLKFGKADETTPRREVVMLAALVEEVGDGLILPRKDSVDWQIDIDPALTVRADREHLYRVIANLVRNAVQALDGQEGGARGTVRVAARRAEHGVEIDIADDGPGIPEKAKAHMFQAFQGSVRPGGTGLGLAIAHELITANGGTISVVDLAKGTCFRLSLPDRTQG